MSNPVEGSDYTVILQADESLMGATVTILYRKPDGTKIMDVTPTNVDTIENRISYKISGDISTEGIWAIQAKVVNASGDVSYTKPVAVKFERELQV